MPRAFRAQALPGEGRALHKLQGRFRTGAVVDSVRGALSLVRGNNEPE